MTLLVATVADAGLGAARREGWRIAAELEPFYHGGGRLIARRADAGDDLKAMFARLRQAAGAPP